MTTGLPTSAPASPPGEPAPRETLPILYRDEHLIAVNKPSGLLVHRSEIDRHETRFALQILRDQIGQRVYPLHRLDKPTSGVLLFALTPDIARRAGEQFRQQSAEDPQPGRVAKQYLAITRGFTPASGTIDHPLKEELDKYTDKRARQNKPPQQAITHYRRLATVELPVMVERYPQSRYSLVECTPLTGRKHQIRRHLKHIAHPIIGDAKHGKGIHNRYFNETYQSHRLLLAATRLSLRHPVTQAPLDILAPLDCTFKKLLTEFNWLHRVAPELIEPSHDSQ